MRIPTWITATTIALLLAAVSTQAAPPPPTSDEEPAIVKINATKLIRDIAHRAAQIADCLPVIFDYIIYLNSTADLTRSYDDLASRCRAFNRTLHLINTGCMLGDDHCTVTDVAKLPFKLDLTAFSDWTEEELQAYFNSRDVDDVDTPAVASIAEVNVTWALPSARRRLLRKAELPPAVDYRHADKNPLGKVAVSSVKDQTNKCGSCWAFAVTGLVESVGLIKGYGEEALATQQLIDCDHNSTGCHGGRPASGLTYIQSNKITTNALNPYLAAEKRKCVVRSDFLARAWADGPVRLEGCDEKLLQQYLASYGPIVIGVQADNYLKAYKSGMLNMTTARVSPDPRACDTNHAMLLVGYGSEAGIDYWIIKNSWGASWGEEGYLRVVRGAGKCGFSCIAARPVYTNDVKFFDKT